MLTLITNAYVYAPRPLGHCQVLVAGSKIAALNARVELSGENIQVVDANGAWLMPGFVDALTHPCGGGGEGGFGNRTGEIGARAFAEAGVTTPVGALGTDAITRSLEVLYGTVMGLRAHGIHAFMYTGSYRVPPVTLTGDVTRDIVLVEPVIGVGEVAISDHRSSQPTIEELRRLASEARLGGVISGKSGTVMVHVGDGPDGLGPLTEALAGSDLPVSCFYPTHANRNSRLLEEAIEFASQGGFVDFTVSTTPEFIEAGEVPALAALRQAIAAGAPATRLTLSSDAGGSLPLYVDGELTGLEAATPDAMLGVLRAAMKTDPDAVSNVIAAMTRNPAAALGLESKGRIAVDHDADLLLLDPNSMELTDVMCRGRWLVGEHVKD
jgi:beta-aspartyl-dipeptidase (metallo-type)